MKRNIAWAALAAAMLGAPSASEAQTYDIDFSKVQPTFDGTQGYDFGTTALSKKDLHLMSYSVAVPDGNYKVTVTVGSKSYAGETTIYAESRRLLKENIVTRKGETQTYTWTLHKRSPRIDDQNVVKIKEREKNYMNWDGKLTLTFCGTAPAVTSIHIEPDSAATTLFLCGNSTVVDQEFDPWASWGQMITRWFDESVCIANYAESGERTTSFMASKRLDKALSMAKAGDIFIVEFGHNDEKDKGAGSGAWYNFSHNLKTFIDRVHEKKCEIVLVTPTARRAYAEGKLRDTHGEYDDATRAVASREKVPLIDLTEMSTRLYEAYGEEGSKHFLVHYAAGTWPDQDKELADNTHFNSFGAYEISKCIVMGLKKADVSVVSRLCGDWADFDPSHPDDWTAFKVPAVLKTEIKKPDGN